MRGSTSSSNTTMNKKELIIGAGVVLVLLSLGVLKIFLQPPQSPKVVARPQEEAVVSTSDNVSATMKARENIKAKAREKALAAIAKNEAAMNANWQAADTPDRLMAVGNLYQYQLGDYYSAIQRYRTLVDDYPNHSETPQAYIEIAACYERLGDEEQAKYVYSEMVESLDPSLQHTAYAKLKLEGK